MLTHDWVAFVNREAAHLDSLSSLPRGALRGHLADRLRECFTFPLAVEGRCLVVGERAALGPAPHLPGPTRLLEVVPEGLTREAAALTGPWLLPLERPLQAGSVLRVALRFADPESARLDEPGLLASIEAMDVEVAVEP